MSFRTSEVPLYESHCLSQIENEYGHFGYDDFSRDIVHLENLKQTLISAGIETLLFTSGNL